MQTSPFTESEYRQKDTDYQLGRRDAQRERDRDFAAGGELDRSDLLTLHNLALVSLLPPRIAPLSSTQEAVRNWNYPLRVSSVVTKNQDSFLHLL